MLNVVARVDVEFNKGGVPDAIATRVRDGHLITVGGGGGAGGAGRLNQYWHVSGRASRSVSAMERSSRKVGQRETITQSIRWPVCLKPSGASLSLSS